jgi:hypothetical protein
MESNPGGTKMDKGFFGPDRNYHYWQLKRHKNKQKLDGKIGYWLYLKEMKEWKASQIRKRRFING